MRPVARTGLTPFDCGCWHDSRQAAERHAALLRRRFGTLAASITLRMRTGRARVGRKESRERYLATPKGKAAIYRHSHTEATRLRRLAYKRSPAGRASKLRWRAKCALAKGRGDSAEAYLRRAAELAARGPGSPPPDQPPAASGAPEGS